MFKYIFLFLICIFSLTSCIGEKYKVKDINFVRQEIVEREQRQTGRRILREQRRKTYIDTINIYQMVLVRDSVETILEFKHKPPYKVGDEIYLYETVDY